MIRAKLHYNTDDVVKTMTEDQWSVFRHNWPGCPRDLTLERAQQHFWDSSIQRLTIEEGLALEGIGVRLDIEGLDGVMLTKYQQEGSQRWNNWPRPDPMVRDIAEGHIVQVTIPDMALLNVRHVTHLDDECTDELQAWLDKGWRILAVCPPNAQRRPDYIIGWMGQGDPQHP